MTCPGLTAAGVAHDPAMEKAEEISRSAYGEHAALFALSDLAGSAP